jgi:hypothetical protein
VAIPTATASRVAEQGGVAKGAGSAHQTELGARAPGGGGEAVVEGLVDEIRQQRSQQHEAQCQAAGERANRGAAEAHVTEQKHVRAYSEPPP